MLMANLCLTLLIKLSLFSLKLLVAFSSSLKQLFEAYIIYCFRAQLKGTVMQII